MQSAGGRCPLSAVEEGEVFGQVTRWSVHGVQFELPNRYKITKTQGLGTYGFVCSGVDKSSGKPIAVKKVQGLFRDTGDAKRILREIKLLKYLNHSCVLSLTDLLPPTECSTMTDFDDLYIVTELFHTDLASVIKSSQQLSDDHISYFVFQLLEALEYLHSHQVIHRDIKPANILVNDDCRIRLCDFGLARGFAPGINQEMTEYVITRWYRPPELLLFTPHYGPAVDIWALGCVMGELFTRQPIFPGKNYIDQIQRIADTLGVDLSDLPSDEAVRFFENQQRAKQFDTFNIGRSCCESKTESEVRSGLSSILPPIVSVEAISLMNSMLSFNPVHRPSAAELLAHPFVQGYDPSSPDGVDGQQTEPYHWYADSEVFTTDFTEPELRSAIWNEIQSINN
eukprot:TRINITY_DN24946_c0_g1_i1.p1 TRINITY_DN24946_c0_g1~~TRINITY_DN24946_c0_g1_i1.p1  ORF type:complete len:397 (+),score=78.31 TRINITY_DN24946_c0_g1_i1:71-1261(+)